MAISYSEGAPFVNLDKGAPSANPDVLAYSPQNSVTKIAGSSQSLIILRGAKPE